MAGLFSPLGAPTFPLRPGSRRVRRAWVAAGCLALAGAVACTPTHTIRVDMTRARPEVLDTPRAVGAGDIVRLVVIDTIWGNRYVAGVNSAAITAVERNLVFGATGLSKLSQTFAPVVKTAGGSRDDAGGGLAFTLAPGCKLPPGVSKATAEDQMAELERLSGRLSELRDSITTSVELLTSNQYDAIRVFALDPNVRRVAQAVADDPLPGETAALLSRLLENPRMPRPTPDALDALLDRVRNYGRNVEAIAALVPAAAQAADVRLGLSTFKEQVLRYRELHAAAGVFRQRVAAPACIIGALPSPDLPLVRRGVDLRSLVNNPALDPAALDLALRRIVRNTELLAATFNALPAWSVVRTEQLALERAFEGNKEVTLSVVRRPRYGRFEARVAEVPRTAPPAKDAAAAAGASGAASLVEARNDTVASVRFETYPRYRFHVGAGFVRSPLTTRSYETTADTVNGVPGFQVRETGETPFQLFPAALVSYSIFPAAGQIFDARVRPGWPSLERAGLAVHAGLSLTEPTRDLTFGASTELFPGLRIGAGYHLSHVQVAPRGLGVFVPLTDGAAVERRWRGEWGALSLALDAQVFFSTIGALLK